MNEIQPDDAADRAYDEWRDREKEPTMTTPPCFTTDLPHTLAAALTLSPADRLRLAAALVTSLPIPSAHTAEINAVVEAATYPVLVAAGEAITDYAPHRATRTIAMYGADGRINDVTYLRIEGARVRLCTFRPPTEEESRLIAARCLVPGDEIRSARVLP